MHGHDSVKIAAGDGRVIGTVVDSERRGVDKHGMYIYEQTERGRANARLVSAAPELLEACQLLVESDAEDSPDDMVCKYNSAIDAAKKAISKAIGA